MVALQDRLGLQRRGAGPPGGGDDVLRAAQLLVWSPGDERHKGGKQNRPKMC